MRLLIIGPQGAGKGTQATLLCEKLGIPPISTGDLFRANIKQGTDLGQRAQQYMNAGQLVPDSVTEDMVADRLSHDDASAGFLLDGFPRTIAQAEWLAELLREREETLDGVVVLSAPDEVLMSRMMGRGRADDTPEAIAIRLELYRSETAPLIEYYGDLVVEIDGVGKVSEIHNRVMARLGAVSSGAGAGDGASATAAH